MSGDGAARRYSLAHLTMMEVPPVELVRTAAAAGYDAVGIRLVPTSDGVDHGILGSRIRQRELRRALDDSGIAVLDVEVVRIHPDGFGDVAAFFALAGELGAKHVVCTMEDTDAARRQDSFGRLCAAAQAHGVDPALEYMVFSAVSTVAEAADIVRGCPGAGVLVDALHHERGGGVPTDVVAAHGLLAPYLQLCDSAVRGRMRDVAAARTEAVYARGLPGAGALPLVDLLRAMPRGTTVSVECPDRGWRRPDDAAAATAAAATALAAAREVVEAADA